MMMNDPNDPVTTVDTRFSMDGAPAVPWPDARQALEEAGTYWLSTVHADGRPHVTTLIAMWHDDALYFSSGPAEQKCKNLELRIPGDFVQRFRSFPYSRFRWFSYRR